MTDADRLLGEGAPLTLTDGRTVPLRYGFRALKLLEDEFGSLTAMQAAVNPEGGGKQFGPLVTVIHAGLSHLKDSTLSADALLDLLDPRHIKDYAAAMSEALKQAFPAAAPTPAEKGVDDAAARVVAAVAGPGPSGTTQPPSPFGVPMPSSG